MYKETTMKRILPAYPLWIIDPNFSIWSEHDSPDNDTTFWTGKTRRAYGFLRYDGTTYCFLGRKNDTVSLAATDVKISAFATTYNYSTDKFDLTVEFLSPLPPDELTILSCPVCYTSYKVSPRNGRLPDDFSVAIALDEEFCYDEQRAEVVGGVLPLKQFEAAFFTRARNLVMSNANDCIAPDWGDTYIAGDESWFISETAISKYILTGTTQYIRNNGERNYIMSVNRRQSGFFMTAYDDRVSIFYFGQWLKGYYFDGDKTIVDAMRYSYENYEKITNVCKIFDQNLQNDCAKYGPDYYTVCCASLRQSVGAHKLVKTNKGDILFLSKECDSNGCIGTADVSYPSTPLYLLYNPELVNGMLRGIFDFARKDVWTFDFAPHDIGTYPWCSGQVYGTNQPDNKYDCNCNYVTTWPRTHQMLYLRPAESDVYDFNSQMPVEECGNMLVMTAAVLVASGDNKLAKNNFDLLKQWVRYLEKFGLKPENQLCTDDFAGHLANNVNLAIKALCGIEAFAIICQTLGKHNLACTYFQKATTFATKLKSLVGDGIMPLAYGQKDTYSLKYNILFDKLFGFDLIGNEICERETDYYIAKANKYGTPLDTRKDYTKSDWQLWTAALTEDVNKAKSIIAPIAAYLAESDSRKPFGDWYKTTNGLIEHFFNRTVQGGNFAPILRDKQICRFDTTKLTNK